MGFEKKKINKKKSRVNTVIEGQKLRGQNICYKCSRTYIVRVEWRRRRR